jgi:hypothetical protein
LATVAITATTHLRMILADRARSLVHWSDGEQSKIRMQEPRAKISGRKIGDGARRAEEAGEQGKQDDMKW